MRVQLRRRALSCCLAYVVLTTALSREAIVAALAEAQSGRRDGGLVAGPAPAGANYVLGPRDVLLITVWDQENLNGKFAIEADGSFTYPFIGRVKAGGLSVGELEAELKHRLAQGYFRNPQLTVAVEQYRSQRVFVVGEVKTPDAYPITGNMTLIEVLARAGSPTERASGEALVVRPRSASRVDGPLLPGRSADAEVIAVDIRDLQKGELSRNITLRDGDTVFLPRAELVYVFGQVRMPGAYPMRKDTSVLQALSLAGGVTDRGSTGRIRIIRIVNGEKKELKAKPDDLVQADDTVIVRERIF